MNAWQSLLVCAFIVAVAYPSHAVDKSNFKTVEQCGFARRNRNVEPGQSHYAAVLDSFAIGGDGVLRGNILNTKNGVLLSVEIYGLRDRMIRFKVNELSPIKPRYEVEDVIVEEPATIRWTINKQDSSSIEATISTGITMLLSAQPFRMDFYDNKQLVFSVNSRGLMKFEHLRERRNVGQQPEEGPGLLDLAKDAILDLVGFRSEEGEDKQGEEGEGNEEGEGEQAGEELKQEEEEEEVEEPDMWEETFKSHTDRKPNGPTSVGMDFSFPGFEHVYGIPEHADTLALKTTGGSDPYRLYNLDVFEYELDKRMALYGSVPLMLAHNKERTVGLFWLNAAETWIDISSNTADKSMFGRMLDYVKGESDVPQVDTHWYSESGIIDTFLIFGPSAMDVMSQYTSLTGKPYLPPLFSIAYHQCRWNYNDEEDVKQVDANFDAHDIPCDVIWLDIEHTDGKRYFTWDTHKFPDPGRMLDHLGAKGRKMVTIVDPHVHRDNNYFMYSEGKNNGYFVQKNDGSEFEGWCWPGSSSYPDFTRKDVRDWWADKLSHQIYAGSRPNLFNWNDMNEPSVFNGPEVTMHKDSLHANGWEHRDVHNLYGLYFHMANTEGQIKRSGGTERPFILTRAFYAGTQRYGAIWTGDNAAEWGHLKASNPMILSIGLAGIPFAGADVGGFFKNPDEELLTRWYQAGAYQPFFRAHAHIDTKRREPWLLQEENKNIIRSAIRARYALLPFWYTLFFNSSKTGLPVMRPMWMEFPTDVDTFTMEDQYMLGDALLVSPVTERGLRTATIYFPGADPWYDVDTYFTYQGPATHNLAADLDKIPVFQRGGSIIPRKERVRRCSALTVDDPYTLTIALGRDGTAKGDLYIDDGHSFDYKEQKFIYREFEFSTNRLQSRAVSGGSFTTKSWLERVVIIGIKSVPQKVELISQTTTQLSFTTSHNRQVLTIRKPGVNIGQDWTIRLS
ncbi:neutral alpha-glucosidase AB-like isoform X1 [Diadema antillarum]|uniref:neutral alpha-glucosidase AB-like isoform X1 n=1 Tax=Diadema antillarum TaxID=105358 RepID=UPI003A83CEC4